jgi:hypothetical protein
VPKKVRVNVSKGATEKQLMDALEELGMGIPAGLRGKKLVTRFRSDTSRYSDKVPTRDAKGEFMMNEGDKFVVYKGVKKAGMKRRAYGVNRPVRYQGKGKNKDRVLFKKAGEI